MKANKTMRGQVAPNYRRRRGKESENTTYSAAHKADFKLTLIK
jgi:hypothetical protein